MEVPPEINDDDAESEGEEERSTDNFGLPAGMIDDIVDGFVEEEGNSDTSVPPSGRKRRSLPHPDQQGIMLSAAGAAEDIATAAEVAAGGVVDGEERRHPKVRARRR